MVETLTLLSKRSEITNLYSTLCTGWTVGVDECWLLLPCSNWL